VRQKPWQFAGEIQIVADNDGDRSLQNLRLIGFRSKPREPCLPSGLRTQTNRAGLLFADVGPHFRRS
jgi:hypothetical protein